MNTSKNTMYIDTGNTVGILHGKQDKKKNISPKDKLSRGGWTIHNTVSIAVSHLRDYFY